MLLWHAPTSGAPHLHNLEHYCLSEHIVPNHYWLVTPVYLHQTNKLESTLSQKKNKFTHLKGATSFSGGKGPHEATDSDLPMGGTVCVMHILEFLHDN